MIELDAFAGIEANIQNQLLDRFDEISRYISPSYLLDDPYRRFMISVARGDGKMLNIFHRAHLNESAGGRIAKELSDTGIVSIEESREAPIKRVKGEDIPKPLRGYRIQPKVRFAIPFYRFWFGFIEPYRMDLQEGEERRFWDNFHRHRDRAQSLIFEQLSNKLLVNMFSGIDPVVSYGSWWDRVSEYDLLALTAGAKVILGECKYKGRKITRAELTKLKEKALRTGIKVDKYILFSRNGFSRELKNMAAESLILKDINDYAELLV